MKKWIIRILILIIYSFPYVYFGMYTELITGSMIGDGIMLVVLVLLTIISQKTNNLIVSILGNIISFSASYVLLSNLTCEKASCFFVPFGGIGWCKIITVVMIIVQIITIAIIKKCKEE